ncbi:phosphate-starvation-inducible PsiE family protein [Methanoculleus sp. Wushi-C6]|uniref:Phosphate-starvation-inducible PsiE family protein n=1 Tax=Methanoculleus caldifontis TaxID=2651577 RepID=A0ABU3WZQ6_9EURY|nr:phosphate-starvation-inducible PsiE family protein [Methanoculleus sp. Wushi-C6]MDV2481282.1 phosphate-starvation-inducible PsiE family protein [Methanoculleus sp. Wushi-C6]
MSHDHQADTAIAAISWVTRAIYLLIAASLSILAIFSFYDVILQVITLAQAGDITQGILRVLHALLVTLIIVEILETVTVYLKTSRVLVTPILIAGITAMVRRVLTFGVEHVEPVDIVLTLAAIVVLTAAVVYIGRQERENSY